jgi:hypothetical protein
VLFDSSVFGVSYRKTIEIAKSKKLFQIWLPKNENSRLRVLRRELAPSFMITTPS